MENVPELLRDMQDFDRMNDDHPDRTYIWLRYRCDQALDVFRAKNRRNDFAKTLHGGKGPGAAAQEVGKKKK